MVSMLRTYLATLVLSLVISTACLLCLFSLLSSKMESSPPQRPLAVATCPKSENVQNTTMLTTGSRQAERTTAGATFCATCSLHSTCNDGVACTIDTCTNGFCKNDDCSTLLGTACVSVSGGGSTCSVVLPTCTRNPCTREYVDGRGICQYLNIAYNNACTVDSCSAAGRCDVTSPPTCSNGLNSQCMYPNNCDPCSHVQAANNTVCNDGSVCTDDVCDPSLNNGKGGCSFVQIPLSRLNPGPQQQCACAAGACSVIPPCYSFVACITQLSAPSGSLTFSCSQIVSFIERTQCEVAITSGWVYCYNEPDFVGCPCDPGKVHTANPAVCASCPANHYASNDMCIPCPRGTNGVDQNGACIPCPSGSVTVSGGSPCAVTCAPSTYANALHDACDLCAPGTAAPQAGSQGSCPPCPSGTYQPLYGATGCNSCPPGTEFTGTGATDVSQCRPCPAGTESPTGGLCTPCRPGSWSSNGRAECIKCGRGTYNSVSQADSALLCVACPLARQISPIGSTTAQNCSCPENSVATQNGCDCKAGYGWDATLGECVACGATSFKETVGITSCTECPSGTSVPVDLRPATVSSACKCVTAHRAGGACECDLGYYDVNGECVACPESRYKDFVSNAGCISCPTHAKVPQASRPGVSSGSCLCPERSTLSGDGQTCQCDPGFEWKAQSESCEPCSSTQWKSNYGDAGCTECGGGSSIPLALQPGTSPTQCQCVGDHKVPPTCQCAAGYIKSGSACVACPPSAWKESVSDATSCVSCPTGSAVPLALRPGTKLADCVCDGVGKMATGTDCLCGFGFGVGVDLLGAPICVPCEGGFYKDTIANVACTACPFLASVPVESQPGTNVLSCKCPPFSVFNVALGQCQCIAGYGNRGTTAGQPCVACSNVEWKSEIGNFPCTPCVENSLVVRRDGTGAVAADECRCIANRFKKDGKCVTCAEGGNCTAGALVASPGFWRPNATFEEFHECIPKQACRGGEVTTTRADTITEGCSTGYTGFMCATCNAGYAWSGSSCVPCSAPNAGLIIAYVILTVAFVGYIYWSVGTATVSKLAIFLNYLQLLAQSYVVQSVKFLPMAEFNFGAITQIANLCFYPFAWEQMWLFIMMAPWVNIAIVGLFFAGRMVYRWAHQRFKHPERPCSGGETFEGKPRPSVAVNSVQAIIQLIFFNNLSIAKSCLIMFACLPIFGVSVTYQNYSFQCGTTMHAVFISIAVIWLFLFCVVVPTVVLLGIVLPEKRKPEWMKRYLVLDFIMEDFRDPFKWWEVIFNARRLVFAIIVTVVSVQPKLKVLIFALFALSFLMVQMGCQPYKALTNNLLEAGSLAAILVTFVIQGYVLAYGDPNDVALIFVVVMNGIVALVLLAFVLREAIPMIYHKFRECFANRKRRKLMRAAAAAGSGGNATLKAVSSLGVGGDDAIELSHKDEESDTTAKQGDDGGMFKL